MNGARNGTIFFGTAPRLPKFNQIWCVSDSHEWHMQRHNFLGPHPLGPWEGAKRSNLIQFQLLSQFQIFLKQTLCVFSQMKDIKHFRQDFHSLPGSCPRGDAWGGGGGSKLQFSEHGHVAYQIKGDDQQTRIQ